MKKSKKYYNLFSTSLICVVISTFISQSLDYNIGFLIAASVFLILAIIFALIGIVSDKKELVK